MINIPESLANNVEIRRYLEQLSTESGQASSQVNTLSSQVSTGATGKGIGLRLEGGTCSDIAEGAYGDVSWFDSSTSAWRDSLNLPEHIIVPPGYGGFYFVSTAFQVARNEAGTGVRFDLILKERLELSDSIEINNMHRDRLDCYWLDGASPADAMIAKMNTVIYCNPRGVRTSYFFTIWSPSCDITGVMSMPDEFSYFSMFKI